MASVQFNLLPDVKMSHVKAQRSKNLIASAAILTSAVAVGIFVVLFLSVNVVQKKMLSDADADIGKYSNELKSIPDIEKILTVQNQLNTLKDLHRDKHVASRIFTYLPQVTPANVTISKLTLDLSASTLTVDGTADSQISVNTFIDTLKFTNFKIGEQGTEAKAFPSVTESLFTINDSSVSYGLTVIFDPALFANNHLDDQGRPIAPILVVPKLTTTHATSGGALFKTEESTQ